MTPQYPLYINGEFKDSKIKQCVGDPATGEIIAQVAVAEPLDVELALESSRNCFDKGSWQSITLKERKELLLRISQGILDNAAELAKMETLNTGKPIKESTFMDVPSAAKSFEYFANNLEKYLEAEELEISVEARSNLLRQPQGVAVLIVPWNYPLIIASWKLSQALAAGNCVILKPSSQTPITVLMLGKIIHDAGLPKGVVNIVNGLGPKIGEVLCSDKRVDMISFTGSNEVGRQIMNYSANNVKKLILELGGKSAAIVAKDADLELAVNGSLCSIFLNQGQMCTAMSRILVDEDIYEEFVSKFIDKAKRIKLGQGIDYQTQMGPLISEAQRKKVLNFVEKAKQEGAQLLCGGKIPDDNQLKNGFFFEPTVFGNVSSRMSVFNEEIFGPVASLTKFSEPTEAIELANKSEFGLACSIWSKDVFKAQDLAAKINAGIVWINTYGMFYDQAPYGGFKQSGFGKELGKEGFLEYTKLKNVIIDTTKSSKPIVNYWYGF